MVENLKRKRRRKDESSMDMQEFKKIWDAHDGWNRCMMIVFDNSARWILDWKNYHQVFREERDLEGNLVSSHLVPNSPKGFLKEDGTPDYMDLHDYLTINEELGTLEMKRYFIGTTPDEILDKQVPCKKYGIEVRHVENVQLMIFADENNADARGTYPCSMT
jgi:hypothetical protein